MGVDAFKESFIVDEENVNSALVFFSKALQCNVGNMIPQLQILRGKCLKIKVSISAGLFYPGAKRWRCTHCLAVFPYIIPIWLLLRRCSSY